MESNAFTTRKVYWPPILNYHAVTQSVDDPHNICVSPTQFEAQIPYLKHRNLRGASIQELFHTLSMGNGRGLVGITFDDAYENFLQTALPVLEKFGFSCTVFVPAGMIGGESSWSPRMQILGVDDIREVYERGMEIGSHSINHISLSGLEPELLEQEVSGSRQILSELLGEEIQGFCYPFGDVDSRAIRAVQQAGYAYGCSNLGEVERRSVYTIPRIHAGERDVGYRLRMKFWIHSMYVRMAYMKYTTSLRALARRTPIKNIALKVWYQ